MSIFFDKFGGQKDKNSAGLAALNRAMDSGWSYSRLNDSGIYWGQKAAAKMRELSANSGTPGTPNGSGPWYPRDDGYSSYEDWLSDDNYVGPTRGNWGTTGGTSPIPFTQGQARTPAAAAPKPVAPPKPTAPPRRDDAPAPTPAPEPDKPPWQENPPAWWSSPPPQPTINFSTPEPKYQPTVWNRQTAVNNQSLKIGTSKNNKPLGAGGTTGFKRSNTKRNFGANQSMRINNSLTV